MAEGNITEVDVGRARHRASLAESILSNPLFKEVFDQLKIRCFEEFGKCPTQDTNRLVHLRLMMSVTINMEQYLKGVMSDAGSAEELFESIMHDKVI